MTKRPLNLLLPMILFGILCMNSVVAKLATSANKVKQDLNNSCYYGSVDVLLEILTNTVKEFEDAVNISGDSRAQSFSDYASGLGDLKSLLEQGKLTDENIDAFKSQFSGIINEAEISNVSQNIKDGNFDSLIKSISGLVTKHFEGKPVYTPEDFNQYLFYKLILRVLNSIPEKGSCVDPKYVTFFDKLKADLNQETAEISKLKGDLTLDKSVLRSRVGIAFSYVIDKKDIKDADSDVDLLILSNYDKDGVLHLVKLYVTYNKDEDKLYIIYSIGSEIKHTVLLNEKCSDFIFVTLSIEKTYKEYLADISIRQFISNTRDHFRIVLTPNFVEGALLRTGQKIKRDSIHQVNEIRCSDDPIAIQEDEIEVITQISDAEIKTAQRSLKRHCDNIEPPCDYIDKDGKCITCNSPTILKDGKCLEVCPDGNYVNKLNECKPCGCDKCYDEKTCIICTDPEILKDGKCVLECPKNTFKVTKIVEGKEVSECKPCSEDLECEVCKDRDECKVCTFDYVHEGKCVEECPPNFYADNNTPKKCIPCTDECDVCGNKTHCIVCKDGFYKTEDNKCVQVCLDGTTIEQDLQACVPCPPFCLKCLSGECKVCEAGFDLVDGVCLSKCTDGTTRISDGSCAPCIEHCVHCPKNDRSICIECDSLTVKDTNGKCVFECKDGQYVNDKSQCKVCETHCEQCTDSITCTKCDPGYFLYNNDCVTPCPNGHYENGSVCSPCGQDLNCKTCVNPDQCVTCPANTWLNNEKKCVNDCTYPGEYKTEHECKKCTEHCVTCDDNGCITCEENFYLKDGICVDDCGDGATPVKGICKPCQVNSCDKCETDIAICDTCKKPLVNVNGKCVLICPANSFNSNGVCLPCITNCVKCDNKDTCIECDAGFALDSEKKCVVQCDENQYKNDKGECVNCTKTECSTCDRDPDKCDKCPADKFKHEGNCINDCPAGTIENRTTMTCDDCLYPCETCSKAKDICDSCEEDSMVLKDGKCSYNCKEGQVRNASGVCEDCDLANCETCKPNREECKVCKDPKVTDEGSCVDECPPGKRLNESKQCEKCNDADCLKCSQDKDYCEVCKPPKVLDKGDCKDYCSTHTYNEDGSCKECPTNCKECNALLECIDCHGDKVRHEGECKYVCPDGTYKAGSYVDTSAECLDCERDNCKQCVNEGHDCHICDNGLFLYKNECISNCPIGTQRVGDTCVDCKVENCAACPNIDTCIECKAPNFLIDNHNCGECPSKTTPDHKTKKCLPCEAHCLECRDTDTCTKCEAEYQLNAQADCVLVCPDGTTKTPEGKCLPCSDNDCIKCDSLNQSICNECKEGTYLFENDCVTPCPKGTFSNVVTKNCDNCNVDCETCTNSETCDTCKNGLLPVNGVCPPVCPSNLVLVGLSCKPCETSENCIKCPPEDLSVCLKCKPGYILFENDCIEECPEGYVEIAGPSCKKCPEFCKSCDQNEVCEECFTPRILNFGHCVIKCGAGYTPIGKECEPCPNNCEVCNANKECITCNEGYNAQIIEGVTVCVEVCINGFYPDNRVCVECTDPNCIGCSYKNECHKCDDGFYLENNKCVEECKDGYTPVNGKCEKCDDPYCLTCRDKSFCEECKYPKFVYQNECITNCPLGTKREGDTCVPCPNDCNNCPLDPDVCAECKYPKVLDGITGECTDSCEEGNIPWNGVCYECEVPNCKECFTRDDYSCKECKDGFKLSFDFKSCDVICDKGFYPDKNNCVPCKGCPECDKEGHCTKCDLPLVLKDGKCENVDCKPGEIKTDEGKCEPCSKDHCDKCPNIKECIQCLPGYQLNDKYECVIVCPDGSKEKDGVCAPCLPNCKKCWDECIECNTPYVVLPNGACELLCEKGFVPKDGKCLKCEEVYSCQICNPDNLDICIVCKPGYIKKDDSCVIDCGSSYWVHNKGDLGDECQECPTKCKICENDDKCDKCEEGYLLKLGKCVKDCGDGWVVKDDECIKCTYDRCNQCIESDPKTCIICDTPYVLVEGTCQIICPPDTFKNSNNECKKCNIDHCYVCETLTTCKYCDAGYTLSNGKCEKDCEPTFYKDNQGVCRPCEKDECGECKALGKECISCINGYLLLGKCYPNCPEGYYNNVELKICSPCDPTCESCTSSAKCIKCTPPSKLENGKCVTICEKNEAKVNDDCIPCSDPHCVLCPADPKICKECDGSTSLFNDGCVTTCPSGTYSSNGQCLPCNDNCQKCPSLSSCITCDTGYKLLDGSCVKDCPNGTRVIQPANCVQCSDPKCLVCDKNDKCIECKYLMLDGKCVDFCPPGFFACEDEKKCKPCIDNCQTCSNSRECEICKTGFILQNGKCVEQCKDGYVPISNECEKCTSECKTCLVGDLKKCSECKDDQYLYLNVCYDVCPSGTYPSGKVCLPCDNNCKECIEDSKHCTECKGNQVLLSDYTCKDKCPAGMVEVNGECKRCTDPSCENCDSSKRFICYNCIPPKVLIDDTCVDNCNERQYRDGTKCIDCPAHCKECDKDGCDTCDQGYFFDSKKNCDLCIDPKQVIDNKCVDCLPTNCLKCKEGDNEICIVCPENLVLIDGECKSTCPPGTYKDGQSCKDCEKDCLVCTNGTTCDKCKDGKVYINDKCEDSCPAHFVENDLGVCVPCTDKDNCIKCLPNDPNECIICTGNTIKVLGKCVDVCPPGSYYDDIAKTCNQCEQFCKVCIGDECKECIVGYYLKNGDCVKDCGSGFYANPDNGKCEECSTSHCDKCDSSGCINCVFPLVLTLEGKCESVCQDGSYPVDRKCEKCDTGCEQCDVNGCIKCIEPLRLTNGECKQECPTGQTSNNGICVPCSDLECNKCEVNRPGECINCKSPKILLEGACVDVCTNGTFRNNKNECENCDPSCETCTGPDSCTPPCPTGFIFDNGQCISTCPDGKFKDDDQCVPCTEEHCEVCKPTTDGDECVKCELPYILRNGDCVEDCPSGTHYDADKNICTNCPRGCTLCNADGSCNRCKKDYFLQHGHCDHTCNSGSVGNCSTQKCDACHPSCKSCVAAGSNSCLECSSGYLFQGDKCVFEDNCLEGFYPDKLNGVCQKCVKNHCKSCDNAQSCTACTENYHLKGYECVEDFDIKPILVGSLTATPSTPEINGEVVIKDKDIGNPLQSTTTLTLFTLVTSVGLGESKPDDSITTIVSIVSSKLDLTIDLSIDNNTDKCIVIFRHESLTHRVNGQDCSDVALDAPTHLIVSLNLYGDKIHADIITGRNTVVNKISEDFVFAGLTALGESDTYYVISRLPESKNQAHSISDVFISSSKASDEIIAKIASQVPVENAELSCRNADKCKEENKFIVVTQGYVDENVTLEVNDTALSKINDILTERFALETTVQSLKDGTEVSILYTYKSDDSNIRDTVALGIVVDKSVTEVTASHGVITIPEFNQEWTHVIISTEEVSNGTHYTIKIEDSNGNVILNKAVDVANEINNPKFFNDSKFESNVPVIGVFIHLNSVSEIKELSVSIQEKKDDFYCESFDKNAHCIKCRDGYSNENSDKCESINTTGCQELFSFVQIQHNEIHEIRPTKDTLEQENLTLVINFRRQVHAIVNEPTKHTLIGIRNNAAITSILTEEVTKDHQYTYSFGKSNITIDFNSKPFDYIVVIVEFFTSTNQASITLHYNGQKSNVERINVPQIEKIVLGDNTKDQINTEFKSSLICKKSLTEVEIAAILENKPKEVDAACIKADHSSGNCLECAAGGNPTDSTKCNPYLIGYSAEYKTPYIETAVRNERYITELSEVNTEASSSNFLVVARIAVYEAENGLYNILKLENENIKNTENTPLHLLSINAEVQSSTLLVQVEIHTAFDGEKVVTLTKPVTKGEFAFVSVEFKTGENKVIIVSDLEAKPIEIITTGAIEKLQPSAQLSLFGIRTPEDKNIIAELIHTYLVPNVNDQGSKITELFRTEEKYLPIVPSDILRCDFASQDGSCLKCETEYEFSNGKCEKSVEVNSLDKGYYIITEGITTSAAVSHTIRNPFPSGDFTLSFYVKLNYVKYDSQDKLIEAGPIKVYYTENEGTIVIKVYIEDNKNLFGPYTLPEVQKWLSFVISLGETNTYIYIRDASTGVIVDSAIVTATAPAPDRITINNSDNSKFVANVHITQENYGKSVLPAPEDKSINCDLSISNVCISADFGLDQNGQNLPHFIDIYNFVVAAKDAPVTIDIDSILKPESTLSSSEFTIAFNVEVNQNSLGHFPAFIDIVKIQFAGETGNYIEIKTNKENLQEYSVELKSFYTTMKLGHKKIDLVELPREPKNDQTAIIISVDEELIKVLIYNSPSNYASVEIHYEGNLDKLTSSAQLLFGDKVDFSENVILSITDLTIEPEHSVSKTEMFNIAVEITEKLQEACAERESIKNSCSKCENGYSLISDNNGVNACVPKSGLSFAYNVDEIVHVNQSNKVDAVFHLGTSVSDIFVSVNVQNTHFSEKTELFSVQLDKILVLEVFAVEDRLISYNYLTSKSNEINNVFDCSKAKPFQNIVVEYSIVNGVTTLSVYDKMLEEFNSDKSFSDTTRTASSYQTLKVSAGFTNNGSDSLGFEVGSILATVNSQASINSDEIKLLATNQSRNNNSCRSNLSEDGYELCSLKNNSEVEIKHANNKLFNPLSSVFNDFNSLANTLTYQLNLKLNVKDITETDNVNKNVLFAVDNSISSKVAQTYTTNDIISEATEGSCRLTITNINDRILIVTGKREIEVLDQRFDVSDYKNIEIHVIVDADEKTIEVRTKADDITFKQFITNVSELEGVNPYTHIYSSTDIEATISLSDNAKPSEVIDCDRFKIEKDHCNIENCNGCLLSPQGNTECLQCSSGYTLAVNNSKCLPTTNVVQPGFVTGN